MASQADKSGKEAFGIHGGAKEDGYSERENKEEYHTVEVHALEKAIRSKPSWEKKIMNESIAKRYKSEAMAAGVPQMAVEEALAHLLEEVTYILGENHAPKFKASSSVSKKKSSKTVHSAAAPRVRGPVTESVFKKLQKAVALAQPKIPDGMEEHLEEKGNDVWHVDNVVPTKLREFLASRLDAIADLEEKDFHPDSNNQVQDLIHPSLFPYIENVSPVIDESTLPPKSAVTSWARQYEDSKYQWLPSQFRVETNGSVKVTSYINNLEKESNQDLYKAIELIFGIFLPMFEKIMPHQHLRGRELQVIVKAANYIVQPNGEVYEGAWHVEGMSHEHIAATGIYYYHTSPCLKDDGLEFRRERNSETDYPEILKYHIDDQEEMGEDFPEMDGLQENILLGAVPTEEGRLLVFPNGLQHKVSGLKNVSLDQVGVRKILVFFLVDPDTEIVSSKHIPEQQWEWKVPELLVLLTEIVLEKVGKAIPEDVVLEILSRAKLGLTMVEARRHRLELMRERKFKIENDIEAWEREYSLCEH